jgi:hypothetical protein
LSITPTSSRSRVSMALTIKCRSIPSRVLRPTRRLSELHTSGQAASGPRRSSPCNPCVSRSRRPAAPAARHAVGSSTPRARRHRLATSAACRRARRQTARRARETLPARLASTTASRATTAWHPRRVERARARPSVISRAHRQCAQARRRVRAKHPCSVSRQLRVCATERLTPGIGHERLRHDHEAPCRPLAKRSTRSSEITVASPRVERIGSVGIFMVEEP